MQDNRNLTWHNRQIHKEDYHRKNGHRSRVLWFTGLSGSGKSTVAHAVEEALFHKGWYTYLLDGDNVRHGLNANLGFSDADRKENIRRIGEVAKLFVDSGALIFAAFISPFRADRDTVRALLEPGEFIEIYIRADLKTCESRDPKGLYKKARAGQIPDFTGIDSPYEEPQNPELIVDTSKDDLESCVAQVVDYIQELERSELK
ncbi:adenylyl-sulfate kinase [Myxococcota bacterium]|nr:adenylyl-sulfate kinase [Myxococcota bacterium]